MEPFASFFDPPDLSESVSSMWIFLATQGKKKKTTKKNLLDFFGVFAFILLPF